LIINPKGRSHGSTCSRSCSWVLGRSRPLGQAAVIELDRRGYTSLHAVENPLTSLAEDARPTQQMIKQIDGSVLLVGHSNGGT
jgi:hypothetical protein